MNTYPGFSRRPGLLGKLVTALLLLSMAPTSVAVYSVSDAKVLVEARQLVKKASQQINQLDNQLRQLESLDNIAKNQLNALTGNKGFGQQWQTARDWMPGSLEEFHDMMARGYNPGFLGDRLAYYDEIFPLVDASQINPNDPESLQRAYYAQASRWTSYNMAAADQIFQDAERQISHINDMIQTLDAQAALKDTADLNNRLVAELLHLQQTLVQLQGLQLNLAALSEQNVLNDIHATAVFFSGGVP